jgi:tryptophan-rich sensory protein
MLPSLFLSPKHYRNSVKTSSKPANQAGGRRKIHHFSPKEAVAGPIVRITIGTIWLIIYPIILVSFGAVLVQWTRGKVPGVVALPFAINLTANLLFTQIQFGMRNLPLAALDILIVWATIIWCVVAIWPHLKWVAIAQVPYFVWVSIATWLQLWITTHNWGK